MCLPALRQPGTMGRQCQLSDPGKCGCEMMSATRANAGDELAHRLSASGGTFGNQTHYIVMFLL